MTQSIKSRDNILQPGLKTDFGVVSVLYIVNFYLVFGVIEVHFEVFGITAFVDVADKQARFAIIDAKVTFVYIIYSEKYTS